MAIQNAVEVDLQYVEEVTPGTTPATPQMIQQRRVSSSLALNKATFQSQEARLDRNISDFRHGLRTVAGDIVGEVSVGAWDDFIEAGMGGEWDTEIVKSDSDFTSIAASSGVWTVGSGSLLTQGLRVGDVINFGATLSESSNNNKNFIITDIPTATTMTTFPAPADMSADTTFTLTRRGEKVLIGGSGDVMKSFTIEQGYLNITQYEIFRGMSVGSMALALTAEGMLGITCGFLGLDKAALTQAPLDATPTAVPSNPILAALNGALVIGSSEVAVVTGINVTLNNNLTSNAVVGRNVAPKIFRGSANVSGNFTAFFEDATIPDAFDNETILSLHSLVEEPTGTIPGYMRFSMPAIKLGGATKTITADGGVLIDYPFQALLPATATKQDASALIIQRS